MAQTGFFNLDEKYTKPEGLKDPLPKIVRCVASTCRS